jgi:geranylgeranyl reductase family protein
VNAMPRLVDEAEVVVVGGGPAGSVAAATLAEQGRDVLVIDQSAFPREKPCGDGLTHSAVEVLEELGLQSVAENGQPVEDCRIVIAHGTETQGWYKPPPRIPRSRFMRTVPRRALDQALLDAALERGARFMQARVDEPLMNDGETHGVALSTPDGGGRVAARCVIAADGATSRMRRASGIGEETVGSQVYAVRRYFTSEQTLDPVFDVYVPLHYEGGLLAGYGWVFPIAERRANVGVAYYGPPAGRPRARIRRVLSAFVRELQEREADRFGRLTDPSRPIGSPIAVHFSADRCQLGNLLLCGEAAQTADPLTGEGISFSMRSGRAAARAADSLLRTGAAPRLGPALGRQFPRLGQNLSLLTRVAVGAGDGFSLAEPEHQRFVLGVRRVTGSAPDEPGLESTEVYELLAGRDGLGEALDAVNERLLDSLRTSFPFGLETLHREVRARGGPVAAACALAAASAARGGLDEAAIAAAEAAQLVALVERCFPRLSPRVGSDVAWINNAMSVLLGDLAISAALGAPIEAPGRSLETLGEAIRRIAEGEMIEAEDRYDSGRTIERCVESLEKGAGSGHSLAASLGAIAAGADGDLDALARYGHDLGIALQLSENIRDLTVGDELTRRRPGSDLREGSYTLPVVYALEADRELRLQLDGPVSGRAAGQVVARIRKSGALEQAGAECRRHAMRAAAAASELGSPPETALTALAELPIRRLEGALGEHAGMLVPAAE